MSQYTSYFLYQKYEKRGEQDFVPCYPNTYSISGDATNPMQLVVKSQNDTQCGYQPCTTMERWVEIPTSEDYECGDCEVGFQYRYVSCDVSAYTYIGDYIYEILCEQVSEDNGVTWRNTNNTKVSDTPIGAVEKKIKIIMDNGDIFAASCGDGRDSKGRLSSYPSAGDRCYSQNTNQKTTNVMDNDRYFANGLGTINTITFGDCVNEIGSRYYFSNSQWGSDTYTNANSYGASGFNGLGIENVNFPNTLKWIGGYTFRNNNIRTLTIPSSVESIGYLHGWDRTSDKVTTYGGGSWAFGFNRRLTEVNLNEGLKSIGVEDFAYCSALQRIEFPSTLESLGRDVFVECPLLKQIIFKSPNHPQWQTAPNGTSAGFGLSSNSDVIVYVPCGSEDSYRGWISDIPDERIVGYSGNCDAIPSIESMYNPIVTYTQGNYTNTLYKGFKSSYSSKNLADIVTSINGLGYIDSLIVHDGVTCNSYENIPNIKQFVLNTSSKINGINAYSTSNPLSSAKFNNFTSQVEEVVINTSLQLNSYSFGGNNYLTAVTISSGAEPTLWSCFQFCERLEELHIDSCVTLKYACFIYCQSLRDVYITYEGGIIPILTNGQNAFNVPFYHSNPTIHVPRSLYGVYKNDPIWGSMNIVIDSDE